MYHELCVHLTKAVFRGLAENLCKRERTAIETKVAINIAIQSS